MTSGLSVIEVDQSTTETLNVPRIASMLSEAVQTAVLVNDPDQQEFRTPPEQLSEYAHTFLGRFIEGDLTTLTKDDVEIIIQSSLRARGHVRPRANAVDYPGILAELMSGADYYEIAERRDSSYRHIYNTVRALSTSILDYQEGKLDLETFLNLEEPEVFSGPTKKQVSSIGAEAIARKPGAPETWFVEPVNLGVPTFRKAHHNPDADDALAWQADALCPQTDPEAFFPEKGGSTRDAKKICANCEVRSNCLEYALENDERFGIWGGLSERERRKLRRRA